MLGSEDSVGIELGVLLGSEVGLVDGRLDRDGTSDG